MHTKFLSMPCLPKMMSAYIHIKLQMIRQRDDLHWQYYALHYQHTHCTVGDKLLE